MMQQYIAKSPYFSKYLLLGTLLFLNSPSPTLASEWGCEVLLCLASPGGWQSIATCKPPMQKLIKCLAKPSPCDFPTCSEAGTGKPKKQKYEDCPQGSVEDTLVEKKTFSDSDEAIMIKTDVCKFSNGSTQPRVYKSKPYYIDVPDQKTGVPMRVWFDLDDL